MKVRRVMKTKSKGEVERMLVEAKTRAAMWKSHYHSGKMSVKDNAEALRNYTALRGVIKSLRWVLNELDEGETPLD
jgi:hypothetical protein|tara:strand:+ start:253 stop:480 length:228 start_codon:yes stop_codon:yes gene_type:complete